MLWTIKRRNGTEQNVSIYPSSRATFIWDLWFFSEMLEVVLRENDLIWFLFWFSRLETRCQVSEKLKNYKGRGLLDETSLVGLCLFYLMSCISVFSRFTFLHRYNYVFVSPDSLASLLTSFILSRFFLKIFRRNAVKRVVRSDPMRYGLENLDIMTFLSLSRRIRTPECLEDFDDILHLQAFSFIFFFKSSRRSS